MFHTKTTLAALALAGSALISGANAAAAWPAKILGQWSGDANTAVITLNITSQSGSGACQTIIGTINDPQPGTTDGLDGYYCPKSGAFVFKRSSGNSTSTFQVYSGSLSEPLKGLPLMMAGSFREYDQVGATGPYTLALFKQ